VPAVGAADPPGAADDFLGAFLGSAGAAPLPALLTLVPALGATEPPWAAGDVLANFVGGFFTGAALTGVLLWLLLLLSPPPPGVMLLLLLAKWLLGYARAFRGVHHRSAGALF